MRLLNVNLGFWILHDKDKFDNGELKKPHYHVYLDFGNNSNHDCDDIAQFLHVENMQFNEYVINKPVQQVRKCKAACERYFMHDGFPGFRYPLSEIHFYNCSPSSTSVNIEDELFRFWEWLQSCAENDIKLTWVQYQRELLQLGFGKWILQRPSYFDKAYQEYMGTNRYVKHSRIERS